MQINLYFVLRTVAGISWISFDAFQWMTPRKKVIWLDPVEIVNDNIMEK